MAKQPDRKGKPRQNTSETRQKPSTLWKPGQSGNPGGRPAVAKNIQELARQHTEAALQALFDALKSPRERVPAAQALLDRGYGRPIQTHNVRQIRDWADLSDEELAVLASQEADNEGKGTRH